MGDHPKEDLAISGYKPEIFNYKSGYKVQIFNRPCKCMFGLYNDNHAYIYIYIYIYEFGDF